jgi:Phytanoyl-CoA dioxygenase (PhyH)
MPTRSHGYLTVRSDPAPPGAAQLRSDGYVVLRGVFDEDALATLRADVVRVFDELPPDDRGDPTEYAAPFRYEMLNRSSAVQLAIGHPSILEVAEFLLGEDCHVIANTAWWQRPGENDHLGRFWHIDAGPHVPRAPGIPWDPRIPYPVFAIAAHLFLEDCPLNAGPTGVVPGSHTSGQAPPWQRLADEDLEWEGRGTVAIEAEAGDVALFVSDVWHRRLPPGPGDPGRMFVQCHYGRRDIAQRLRPTSTVNHLSAEAIARAQTPREKTLVGLHPLGFYDG